MPSKRRSQSSCGTSRAHRPLTVPTEPTTPGPTVARVGATCRRGGGRSGRNGRDLVHSLVGATLVGQWTGGIGERERGGEREKEGDKRENGKGQGPVHIDPLSAK